MIDEAIHSDATHHLEILLFEPQSKAGPGYAYQADFECNLLNTRADAMSAVANDKQHFMKWLGEHGSDHAHDFPDTLIDGNEFLPRSLFGRYLSDHFDNAQALARKHGVQVTRIASEVTDLITLADQTVCLDTTDAGAHMVDRVVLCMGNLPSTNFSHLQGIPGFLNSPYPTQTMARGIPKMAPVCVLGTGLSAIDAVLSLVEAGHCGKIILASRNGRLPSVRGIFNKSRTLEQLTRKNIDAFASANGGALKLTDVFSVLEQEVKSATGGACNIREIMNSGAGILDYISSEIALASNAERLWQSVIYSTNSVIDYVWHRLSIEDKRRFQKTFGSLWSSYRVSFPVKNAHKLHALLRADRVLVFGGVKSVNYNGVDQIFETRIHDHETGFRTIVESEHLINATGYSVQVTQSEVPLIQNLLKRNLAEPSEFGGFKLDFETGRLINSGGLSSPNVSVLGSLAAGTYFWTNAMDMNVRLAKHQAEDTVKAILQKQGAGKIPSEPIILFHHDAPDLLLHRRVSVASPATHHQSA